MGHLKTINFPFVPIDVPIFKLIRVTLFCDILLILILYCKNYICTIGKFQKIKLLKLDASFMLITKKFQIIKRHAMFY